MKRSLLLIGLLVFVPTSYAQQHREVTFTTMLPVPSGNYVNVQAKQMKLKPQTTPPTCNAGATGSLYSTDLGEIKICKSNLWTPVNTWSLTGSISYLSGSDTDANAKVGIGTKTPKAKLHLGQDTGTKDGSVLAEGTFNAGGNVPITGAGTRLMWYPRKAAFRAGYVAGTQWDENSIGDYSVAFGASNQSIAIGTFTGAGAGNQAVGQYSGVVGGVGNVTRNYTDFIGGGSGNETFQYNNDGGTEYAFQVIGGGSGNQAYGRWVVIGGGTDNKAYGNSTVAGGATNQAGGPNTGYGFIGGGQNNQTATSVNGADPDGGFSVVAGGKGNIANGRFSAIVGGGTDDVADGNIASAPSTFVGGGYQNIASGSGAFVGGGVDNEANSSNAVVVGGNQNVAGNSYAFIGAGWNNRASGYKSVVSGGWQNTAGTADVTTVGGGKFNTASGIGATIPGGESNTAAGDYSFAAGRNMQLSAAADRTFAFGYSATPLSITQPDAFIVNSTNVGIGTTSPSTIARMTVKSDISGGVGMLVMNTKTDGFSEVLFFDKDGGHKGAIGYGNSSVPTVFQRNVFYIGAENATTDTVLEAGTENGGAGPDHQEVMRLEHTTGYVGIGTSDPQQKLDVVGNIRASQCFYHSGGSLGNCSSDARLKKNIQSISGSLNKITQLNPVTFKYKDPDIGVNDRQYGLIAQDVEKIYPEWVGTNEKGYKTTLYGSNIEMELIEATKELYGMVKDLKSENSQLKSKVEQQEKELNALRGKNNAL